MKHPPRFRRHLLASAAVLALTPSAFASDYYFSSGTYTAPNPVAAGDTLNVTTGGYKYFNSAVTNNGTVKAADDLYFQNGNVLSNTGVFTWSGDFGLYDGGYNGGFVNSGTLRKSGGTGTSVVAIIGFTNSGTVDAQSGTIVFNSGATFNAGTQFTGAGSVSVTNGASFNGSFSSQNLTLAGGDFNGGAAVVTGTVAWTGGRLNGSWELAAGQALSATGTGGYKYLNAGLLNNGTITAADNLYFQNGNTLTNNGVYGLQGDVSLLDGGYNGAFTNNGSLVKADGSGTSAVAIAGFTNNGTVTAQSGTVNFSAGATFNAGTVFNGAGQVVVSNGATFNGGFATAGNLSFTGGTFAGNAAKINGDLALAGGTLTGDWALATGRTLTLTSTGGYKYLNGSLTNDGTIAAADNLYFVNGNTLTNNGAYKLQGDVSLLDGGYNGAFTNNGNLVKTDGAGTGYVSITGFVNNGTVTAQTGTIAFNAGAVFNAGTAFTGTGQVVVSNGATFRGGFTTAGNLSFTGGNFAGSGATMNGDVRLAAGTLTGAWEVASGRTLTLSSDGGYKYLNGSLTNNGTVAAVDNLYLQNGNTLTNNGVYQLKGDVGVLDGGYNGAFVNNGSLVKTDGNGTSSVAGIGFVNNGTVDVRTGTVALPSGFSNPGTVTGSGALGTDLFTNSGHVAPGTGAGTLTLNGNFAQTTLGFMDIQLASSLSFDEFVVNGTAALHGTLALSCIAACDMHAGDIFTILDSSGDLTGVFDSVTTSGFLDGFAYNVVYDYADDLVRLQVLNAGAATPPPLPPVVAVPEPGSWALMFGGLGVVGALARRRRVRTL